MNFRMFHSISLINTLKINVHYFGLIGIIKPFILCAKNLKISKLDGTVILHNKKIGAIKIGFGDVGIVDNKYKRSIWENTGTIIFRGTAHLGPGTKVCCSGILEIGNSCIINANTDIVCRHKVEIGDNCLISWESLIMDTDFHTIYQYSEQGGALKRINQDESILIGNHVWIGCRVTLLKGVILPENCVLAAGSVVTKKLSETNAIYVSNKKVKSNIVWKL